MRHPPAARRLVLLTTVLAAVPATGHAQATSADRMNAIEAEIRSLQSELRGMRRDLAARDAQVRAARQDAAQARAQVQTQVQRAPAPLARPGAPGDGPLVAAASPGQGGGGQGGGGQGGGGQGGGNQTAGQQNAGQQNASTTPTPAAGGSFHLGGVTVTLGGFVEAAGIFRTRNEVSDIASNLNTGIPFPNQVTNHENEFRATARQSRISLLAEGDVGNGQALAAYFETDFQGGSPTANQNESNSYTLRLRQGYGTYDNKDTGTHVLGGQAWSLLTPFSTGLTPRREDVPLTIDASYVVGFNWARQPQLRVTQQLADGKLWAGLSLEQPQNNVYVGPNGAGTVGGTANYNNPGAGILASTVNYSTDIAPDIVAKLAYDPGWAHLEAYGVLRFLHDRVSVTGAGRSTTAVGGGGGVGASVPLLNGKLVLRANVLAGYGIGRYASGQLPDSTLSQSGAPVPLPEITALAGIVGHPVPSVDLYGYVGTEQVARRAFASGGRGFGYGSPLYPNAGCYTELASGCTANTSGLVEGTLGAWWRFLHGTYGTAQAGAQYAYVNRSIFAGTTTAGGRGNRDTDENVFMLSFRYLPFQ